MSSGMHTRYCPLRSTMGVGTILPRRMFLPLLSLEGGRACWVGPEDLLIADVNLEGEYFDCGPLRLS